MSDEKPKKNVETQDIASVPRGHIYAEGTLSSIDDAQIYADIAETLLVQAAHPLIVRDVARWPRDGHTIVVVKADQSADGTRARKALAVQIEDWRPVVEEAEQAT